MYIRYCHLVVNCYLNLEPGLGKQYSIRFFISSVSRLIILCWWRWRIIKPTWKSTTLSSKQIYFALLIPLFSSLFSLFSSSLWRCLTFDQGESESERRQQHQYQRLPYSLYMCLCITHHHNTVMCACALLFRKNNNRMRTS